MDSVTYVTTAAEFLKKHRLLLLMIALGVILLRFPQGQEPADPPEVPKQTLEARLEQILSQVEGAGDTAVLLTEARGEQLLYQTDGADSRDTVLVTTADRSQTGLLRQRLPPEYRGAVILCQGADSPRIRLQILEAVMGATGLTSDKITVLKMK